MAKAERDAGIDLGWLAARLREAVREEAMPLFGALGGAQIDSKSAPDDLVSAADLAVETRLTGIIPRHGIAEPAQKLAAFCFCTLSHVGLSPCRSSPAYTTASGKEKRLIAVAVLQGSVEIRQGPGPPAI